MPLPYPTLSTGQPIDNLELDANFAAIVDMLRGQGADNFADDAGIRSEQIADRFCIIPAHLDFFPMFSDAVPPTNLATITAAGDANWINWIMPNVSASPGVEFRRFPGMLLRDGKAAYLAAAVVRAQQQVTSGGVSPVFWLTHNGTVLGGGGLTIAAADTDYTMAAMNPFDSRQRSIQTGDYFTIGWGRTATGADVPALSEVSVMLYYFIELSSG